MAEPISIKDSYLRTLAPDELQERREKFTANHLKLEELEEERVNALADIQGRRYQLMGENKILLTEIRTGKAKARTSYSDHQN